MNVESEQVHELTWDDVRVQVRRIVASSPMDAVDSIWGIPRGGVPVALLVSEVTGLPVVDVPRPGTLIVDDLVGSGRTAEAVASWMPLNEGSWWFDALYRKPFSPDQWAPEAVEINRWIRFPWERTILEDDQTAEDHVVRLLEVIGEDPLREGLLDTPGRVIRALTEMTSGMHGSAEEVLSTTFHEQYDQMVAVRGVPVTSLCEHHLLPFTGTATVAYVPDGQVVGLSKIPRLVDLFARRLQVQERLTVQVADALMEHLSPLGVGVMVTASHSCMACRGVRVDAEMVTTALRGVFLNESSARSEFLALARGGTHE